MGFRLRFKAYYKGIIGDVGKPSNLDGWISCYCYGNKRGRTHISREFKQKPFEKNHSE